MDDINLVIFFVYGVLYALGVFGGAYLLIIGAGILLIGTATSLTLFGTTAYNVIFASLLSIFSIYHAIFLIRKERTKL